MASFDVGRDRVPTNEGSQVGWAEHKLHHTVSKDLEHLDGSAVEAFEVEAMPVQRVRSFKDQTAATSTPSARVSLINDYVSGQITEPTLLTRKDNVQRFVISGPWIFLQALTIITDASILVWDWNFDILNSEWYVQWVAAVVLVNLSYWCDIGLRIYAFGATIFFSKLWNVLEFTIVVFSTVGAVLKLYPPFANQFSYSSSSMIGRLFRIFRIFRMLRLTLYGRRTSVGLCDCMRLVTGENKMRFVNAEHDFNLDLCYITPRLVAMSVPASGVLTQFYRNPLSEVVRFFERYHHRHYLIINACPEHPYPAAAFTSGHVHCFDVQDHTPPTLDNYVEFFSLGRTWIGSDSSNVLAVHCRGGKGRTGSFCCAWLLYRKKAEDARDALNFYALCRTDIENSQKTKLQGVETPSQVRYVEYIDDMLRTQDAYYPVDVKVGPAKLVRLHCISAHGLFRDRDDFPTNLMAIVHDRKAQQIVYRSEDAGESWPLGDTQVSGDIRITIFDSSKFSSPSSEGDLSKSTVSTATSGIAGEEPGCLFYFMFHTSFLKDNILKIPKESIDNVRKNKKYKNLYTDDGFIQLEFSPVEP